MSSVTVRPASQVQVQSETQPLLPPDGKKEHYNLVGLSKGEFWTLCITAWGCSILAAFDGTIVATLLGPISSSFLSANRASWLGTAYLLSVCCFTPIYGRLTDIIGRRRTMLVSLAIFCVGNVLCAAAPSMAFLIAARGIAGIGGGGLQTVSSTIVSDIVPLSHRGIFQGFGNVAFGSGAALGPALGGIINDKFGWRWTFWMQIPFFLFSMRNANAYLHYPVPVKEGLPTTLTGILRRCDILGCLLLGGWIGSLLVALSTVSNSVTGEYTFSSPLVIALLAVSGATFLFWVVWEWFIVKYPVVPVELLRKSGPILVAINHHTTALGGFAAMYTIPLFYGTVKLYSPSESGLHFFPATLGAMIGSLLTGYLARSIGRFYWLNIASGVFSLAWTWSIVRWSDLTPEWHLYLDFCFFMIGGGAMSTLTIVALIGYVGRTGVAAATGLSYTARMSGQVLGVGLAGVITQTILSKELPARITGEGAQKIIEQVRLSSAVVRYLEEPYRSAAIASYEKALQAVFWMFLGANIIGFVASVLLKDLDLKQPPSVKPADEESVAESQS